MYSYNVLLGGGGGGESNGGKITVKTFVNKILKKFVFTKKYCNSSQQVEMEVEAVRTSFKWFYACVWISI